MEPLTPSGHVLVDGEIWRAMANEPMSAGVELLVTGHDQMVLYVEPTSPSNPSASPA
jgi:membrane-bound serine protease (ClpP class)